MKVHKHSDRSDESHAILDEVSRRKKGKKIIDIVGSFVDLRKVKLLDIGTGSGYIPDTFAESVDEVTSVDIVDERRVKKSYEFKQVTSEKLPFANSSFDVVVSNHVIEHVPDQKKHVEEIVRATKNGGYIYLATPNKYWITDPHYKLPFISWLPRGVSNKYLQLLQNKEWDIYPKSHKDISKLFDECEVINCLPLLAKEQANHLEGWNRIFMLLALLPRRILDLSKYASPTLIYVIKKR